MQKRRDAIVAQLGALRDVVAGFADPAEPRTAAPSRTPTRPTPSRRAPQPSDQRRGQDRATRGGGPRGRGGRRVRRARPGGGRGGRRVRRARGGRGRRLGDHRGAGRRPGAAAPAHRRGAVQGLPGRPDPRGGERLLRCSREAPEAALALLHGLHRRGGGAHRDLAGPADPLDHVGADADRGRDVPRRWASTRSSSSSSARASDPSRCCW